MAKKKQEEEQSGGAPAWMATYGDLVTLLLCFFVLLFSMSSVDVTKFKAAISSFADQIDIMPGGIALTGEELITNGISQLSEIEIIIENKNPTTYNAEESDLSDEKNTAANEELYEEAKEIAGEIQEALQDEGIEGFIEITYTSNYVRLTLSGEVLFDSGSATIKDESQYVITALGNVIADNGYDQYLIQIEGHTDNIPMYSTKYPNNWYLSSARAIGVGQELITQFEFDPELIACLGYGEYRPIADNDTAEGRAINRRVEMKIVVEKEEILLEESLSKEPQTEGEEGQPLETQPEGEQAPSN